MKRTLCLFLIAIMVAGALFATSPNLAPAAAATVKSGTIAQSTTWTKANSPYNLTGNLLVDIGATLTIQPGVTVNLNNYELRVNGTLIAIGSNDQKITFKDGLITLARYGDNKQDSQSTIQYTVLNATNVYITGGSPLIAHNSIDDTVAVSGGSPIIFGNSFTTHQFTKFFGGVIYTHEAISIEYDSSATGTTIVSDNTIVGSFDDACIIVNSGNVVIQRNLISGGPVAISAGYSADSKCPIITNNTLRDCFRGIIVGNLINPTITYNNFEDTSNYTIHASSSNIDASYNWWGTTDTAAIDTQIIDYNDNFDLGKVAYTPVLTAENTQAMPDPDAAIPRAVPTDVPSTAPTPTSEASDQPSLNPTPTPIQPSNEDALFGLSIGEAVIIILLAVIAVLLVFVVFYMRKRSLLGSQVV